MKYSFSLESVNMLTSGPNFIYKQSSGFWKNYFKYISAAGFRAVELPFNPFSSDPMAFETGRCGIPCNAQAISAKYGSPEEFRAFLTLVGIDEISGVHINANDALLELVASQRDAESYYDLLEELCSSALDHCKNLDCKNLLVTPTPEIGWINSIFSGSDKQFAEKTAEILKHLCSQSHSAGITVAARTEFWSFFRGDKINELTAAVPEMKICPDAAHMHIAGLDVTEALRSYGDNILCPRLTDTGFSDEYKNYERINAEIPVDGPQKVFSDLGDGEVDLQEYAQIIKDSSYEGYVVCEQRKTLDVYRGLLKLRWYLDHEITGKLR